RRAGGHLDHRRAEAQPRGPRPEPGERGEGVRPVRLGGPHGVVAEPLRQRDQLLLSGRLLAAPVSERQSQLHGRPTRSRPMMCFMISLVPPKIFWMRASLNARATGYSSM